MLTTLEEMLISWNTATQEDLKEIVKLWSVIHDIKEYGHGSVEVVIQDKQIVFVGSTKKWRNKGSAFVDCNLTA